MRQRQRKLSFTLPSFSEESASPAGGIERAAIALLEDDEDTRKLYSTVLKQGGYHPLPVGTGASLLALLRQATTPRAIVMDLGLPDTEGIPLCRIIRAHARFQQVPIIAVTGWSSGPYVCGLADAPFNEVLQKPVDTDLLLTAVQRWVGTESAPPFAT